MRSPGDSGDDASGERILRSKKSDGPIIALVDAESVGCREGAVRDLHWISIAGTPFRIIWRINRSCADFVVISLLQKTLETVPLEPLDIEVDGIDLGRIDGTFIGTLMLLYDDQSRARRGFLMLWVIPGGRCVFRTHCAEFLLDGLDRSRWPPGPIERSSRLKITSTGASCARAAC